MTEPGTTFSVEYSEDSIDKIFYHDLIRPEFLWPSSPAHVYGQPQSLQISQADFRKRGFSEKERARVFRESRRYDYEGFLLEVNDGEYQKIYAYKRPNSDSRKQLEKIITFGRDRKVFQESHYSYPRKYLLEEKIYRRDEERKDQRIFRYNEEQKLESIYNEESVFLFGYNDEGLISEIRVKDKEGRETTRSVFSYDERQRVIKEEKNDEDKVERIFYEYPVEDEHNWLKRISYRWSFEKGKKEPLEAIYRSLSYRIWGQLIRKGRILFPYGQYRGGIREERMHGEGCLRNYDGAVYKGEFREGEKEGRGEFRDYDGSVYEGWFRGGQFHGKGICRWPNGDEYRGDFENGELHGKGLMIRKKDGKQLRGIFKHNLFIQEAEPPEY